MWRIGTNFPRAGEILLKKYSTVLHSVKFTKCKICGSIKPFVPHKIIRYAIKINVGVIANLIRVCIFVQARQSITLWFM